MNILFVSTSIDLKANSADIRNNSLIKGLIDNGHKVDCITVKWPDYMCSDFLRLNQNFNIKRIDIFNKDYGVNKRVSKIYIIDLYFKIYRILNKLINNSKYFKSFFGIFRFPDVCYRFKKCIYVNDIIKYDVMISSSDEKSSHFAAAKIKKANPNLEWIQIWGDPWYFDINLKNNKLRAKYAEYKILKCADKIVYVSEATKMLMQNTYKEFSYKMHYIPRGYYKFVEKSNVYDVNGNSFLIAYTGVLTTGRSVTDFLAYIDSYNINAIKKIYIEFYGEYSDDKKNDLNKYDCVRINGSVDYESILNIYSKVDALLFVSNGHGANQIPGKLFDYAGTELPIICLINDDHEQINDLFKLIGGCIPVINDYENIDKKFSEIYNYIGKKVSRIDMFSPNAIAKQFEQIF